MGEKTEETSPLDDLTAFLRAMRSRYGRLPALKRLGRLVGKWFFGGAVFVAICIVGEAWGVGLKKAAGMYWRWWVWPPFYIAATPIAFTLVFSAVQLAFYAAVFPFSLIGRLAGLSRSEFFKRAGDWMVYLGFALFVAWCAHDSARRDAAPKPGTKPVAVETAAPPHEAQPSDAPTSSSHWFNWRMIAVALFSFGGGLAKTTFGSVTAKWAERIFVDRKKRIVIYGPNDRP